jgi:hypothetical protein
VPVFRVSGQNLTFYRQNRTGCHAKTPTVCQFPPKEVPKELSAMEVDRPKCSHIIHRNKYERNAPEITNWWHKLFDLLESEAAIVSW